jgi:hypothetical protein
VRFVELEILEGYARRELPHERAQQLQRRIGNSLAVDNEEVRHAH